jgi:hypothetical protein
LSESILIKTPRVAAEKSSTPQRDSSPLIEFCPIFDAQRLQVKRILLGAQLALTVIKPNRTLRLAAVGSPPTVASRIGERRGVTAPRRVKSFSESTNSASIAVSRKGRKAAKGRQWSSLLFFTHDPEKW